MNIFSNKTLSLVNDLKNESERQQSTIHSNLEDKLIIRDYLLLLTKEGVLDSLRSGWVEIDLLSVQVQNLWLMLVHKVQTVSRNTDKEFLQGFLTTYQVRILDQSVYFSQYILIHNKLVENLLLLSILASQRI